MKIISFCSYKGGVGRSLALAYTAEYLSKRNIGVCILDIDLEAPGIAYKFPEYSEDILSKPGIVDYIYSCIEDNLVPLDIDEYFSTVYQKNEYGYIKIMSAGRRIDTKEYWDKLAYIDWNFLFFSKNSEGIFIFDNLLSQIKSKIDPDYLLIDSRSGVTIPSKICNSVLPDTVVLFLANNEENFKGSKLLYDHISYSEYKIGKKGIEVFCAITRFPAKEDMLDYPEKLAVLDMSMELKIIDNFLKAVSNPLLKKDDIQIIHSDRNVERNELSILQKKKKVFRINIEYDYERLIKKFIDNKFLKRREQLVERRVKYNFIESDMDEYVAEELKTLLGNNEFEDYPDILKAEIAGDPYESGTLYKLALCERYRNNVVSAAINLYMSIDNSEENSEWRIRALYLQGLIFLYDLKNYDGSLQFLEKVYEADKSFNSRIHYVLAICFYCKTKSDKEKAMEHINLYLAQNNLDYRAHLLMAVIIGDNKRSIIREKRDEILSYYNKAIELGLSNPNSSVYHSYNCRGSFYYSMDETEKALSDYNRAIEINPEYESVYNNRGLLYADLNEYEKALCDYGKSIKLKPNYEFTYYNRGLLYSRMGNIEMALGDYNKAIEILPDSRKAYRAKEKIVKPDVYYKALEVDLQYDHYYYDSKNMVDKYCFPVNYHKTDEIIEFALFENDDVIILSDQGKTIEMLDRMYFIKERDVSKNLTAVLHEFHVFRNGHDFTVEIPDKNANLALHEAKYRLLRCVLFLNDMYLFSTDRKVNRIRNNIFSVAIKTDQENSFQHLSEPFSFPARYKKTGDIYEFTLIRKDEKVFLTDKGKTYKMLDEVFILDKQDVQIVLNAIMNKCKITQDGIEFMIEIKSWNEGIKNEENLELNDALHRMLECVSFMDTMKIFYK